MDARNLLKPWSISTAVRSPHRLRGFLSVLAEMEGETWNSATQRDFQIHLIRTRLYGAHRPQFYQGLPDKYISLLEGEETISFSDAAEIFKLKKYVEEAMRGRQSFKPLTRFGFANIQHKKIRIIDAGRSFLAEERDYGDIVLRGCLKWQLPNPMDRDFPAKAGYNIKPFVGVLRLIDAVNQLSRSVGAKEKGVSLDEFRIFALTLIDWQKIDEVSEEIIDFRMRIKGIAFAKRESAIERMQSALRPNFDLRHVRDYADNAVRYFRMTKYISLHGGGGNTYINIEKSRKVEATHLLQKDHAEPIQDFSPFANYAEYLGDSATPVLPGESETEIMEAIRFISSEMQADAPQEDLAITLPPPETSLTEKKKFRDELRAKRLQQIKVREKAQMEIPSEAEAVVEQLRKLANREKPDDMPMSLKLEHLTSTILEQILNDADQIRPNYPVDDSGIPTMTAPGGVADIECEYGEFRATCEVTMMTGTKQWMHESQPVMRHLKDFSDGKVTTYCLFIAPSIHEDSLGTFKYSAHGHYSDAGPQNIAPLTIRQFCDIADTCVTAIQAKKRITRAQIQSLLVSISDSVRDSSGFNEWKQETNSLIEQWRKTAN